VNGHKLKLGWEMAQFGDVAQNIVERADPSHTDADIYVGLEHLDSDTPHLHRWGHPSDVIGEKLAFKNGDIIFGKRLAYQRKLAIAEFDGICSAHAMVLRPRPERVWPDFFPFFLQSDVFMNRAIEISVGSLSPTINWGTLRDQEFALPPIEEQKRIAEILWAADRSLEEYARAKRELETLENQMVTWFLGDSIRVNLGSLGTWVGGGTPSKVIRSYWTGETPWASPKDMRSDELYDTEDHISEEAVASSSTKVVPAGSVIVAVRTGILKHTFPVAVACRSMAINQDLKALLPNNVFLPEFVAAYLRLQAPGILRACVKSGTTVESVDVNLFKKMTIPLPGKTVQEHFSRENAELRRSSATLSEHVLSIRALMKSVIGAMEGSRV